MSRPTPCPACQDGHHERHVGPWNIREGLLGGDSCPCIGDCKPMQMPEWMTVTAEDLKPGAAPMTDDQPNLDNLPNLGTHCHTSYHCPRHGPEEYPIWEATHRAKGDAA